MKVVSKKVEMIAYFKRDGSITPIRFRIEEDEEEKVIKIEKTISVEQEKLCGNKMWVFTCSVIVDNVEKLLELKYDIANCTWILFKI